MNSEEAFAKVVAGVHVITVKAGDRVNGMTAAWVSRVSHVPPLLMVSVGKTRFTHDLIREAGVFCVNVLADGQTELYENFGFSSGRDTDKFKDLEYDTADTGCPVLRDTAAYLDCKLVGECDAGDHTVFIGEAAAADASDRKPLLTKDV